MDIIEASSFFSNNNRRTVGKTNNKFRNMHSTWGETYQKECWNVIYERLTNKHAPINNIQYSPLSNEFKMEWDSQRVNQAYWVKIYPFDLPNYTCMIVLILLIHMSSIRIIFFYTSNRDLDEKITDVGDVIKLNNNSFSTLFLSFFSFFLLLVFLMFCFLHCYFFITACFLRFVFIIAIFSLLLVTFMFCYQRHSMHHDHAHFDPSNGTFCLIL